MRKGNVGEGNTIPESRPTWLNCTGRCHGSTTAALYLIESAICLFQ
jgi:hypothetical protein